LGEQRGGQCEITGKSNWGKLIPEFWESTEHKVGVSVIHPSLTIENQALAATEKGERKDRTMKRKSEMGQENYGDSSSE